VSCDAVDIHGSPMKFSFEHEKSVAPLKSLFTEKDGRRFEVRLETWASEPYLNVRTYLPGGEGGGINFRSGEARAMLETLTELVERLEREA